jgi:hypothetical protein
VFGVTRGAAHLRRVVRGMRRRDTYCFSSGRRLWSREQQIIHVMRLISRASFSIPVPLNHQTGTRWCLRCDEFRKRAGYPIQGPAWTFRKTGRLQHV